MAKPFCLKVSGMGSAGTFRTAASAKLPRLKAQRIGRFIDIAISGLSVRVRARLKFEQCLGEWHSEQTALSKVNSIEVPADAGPAFGRKRSRVNGRRFRHQVRPGLCLDHRA